MQEIYDELIKNISKEEILCDEPMSKHTTFRIGGPADIFVKIKNLENLTTNRYKTEVHHSWDGKECYMRSSYEIEFANLLDENKVLYEVETLRIRQFDTQRQYERIAIPDFYLPETNTIVEIKSEYTLDVQEMKDKVKSYRENGFNFKLILEHKEVDLDTLTENLRETIQTRHKK